MRKISVVTVLFVLLYAGTGCEKPLQTIDLELGKPKLVVQAGFKSDSILKVHLSRSIGILEQDTVKHIENAQIDIVNVQESAHYHLSYLSDGFYIHPVASAAAGREYRLLIKAEGEDLEHTVTIPDKVPFQISRLVNMGNGFLDGEILFSDPEDEKNFYMLSVGFWLETDPEIIYYNDTPVDTVYRRLGFEHMTTYTNSRLIEMTTEEEVITEYESQNEYAGDQLIFSDALINGKRTSISFIVDILYDGKLNKPYLFFQLTSIDEDMYRFMQSMARYGRTVDVPLTEKVQIFTNVNNGLGLVYGSSTYLDSVYSRRWDVSTK